MKRRAMTRVGLAVAGLFMFWNGAAGGEAGWQEARGMPRGTGSDVVKVRTAAAETTAIAAGQPAAQEIRLQYAMPALKAETRTAGGEEKSVLTLGNAPLSGGVGKPMLPVVPCYIALPAGCELDGVEVVCGKETKLAGTHAVPHGQKPIPLLKDAKAEPTAPDAAVYGSDEPWPKARHEQVTVQKKRGMSVLVVNLNPVSYRPKSGAVSYFETLELRVKTKPQSTALASGAGAEPAVRVREDPIRPLSEQVDNPETVESYKALTTSGKPATK